MSNIAVIGAGRVGLVTAACLAHLGNKVVCIERDPHYLRMLRSKRVPFYEPGLPDLISDGIARGLLEFSDSIEAGIIDAQIIFLAVGTPQGADGTVDLTDLLNATESIGQALTADACIVSKSTVPPGSTEELLRILQHNVSSRFRTTIVSNPEFLREGSAVRDFLKPDRIVIGAQCPEDADIVKELYRTIKAPMLITDVRTAELIKSVSNFYLGLRVSFANEVADFCNALQVDALNVLRAVGMDARIGSSYLQPGLGFGGPCLPKDMRGLADSASRAGVETPLIAAALRVNDGRIDKAIAALSEALDGVDGRSICVLGLSFKAGTDDIRGAPSIRFIDALLRLGASVRAHDPLALENFRRSALSTRVRCKSHIEEAVIDADAVAVMTPWPQYRDLTLAAIAAKMRGNVLFDGANMFKPDQVIGAGLSYQCIGRAGVAVAEEATVVDATA